MDKTAFERIAALLEAQRFAVLCTSTDGWPYAGLVAFYAEPDLKTICFATPRNTRKTANLCADGRVALLVDDRSNSEQDCQQGMAVTVLGRAEILPDDRRQRYTPAYLEKHPNLKPFLESSETVMVRIAVQQYRLVEQFQSTTDLRP